MAALIVSNLRHIAGAAVTIADDVIPLPFSPNMSRAHVRNLAP